MAWTGPVLSGCAVAGGGGVIRVRFNASLLRGGGVAVRDYNKTERASVMWVLATPLPADADSETEGFGGSATVADDGSTLTLAPPAKKDFWRRTFYEPTMIKGDASALLCEVGAKEEATLELTFSFVAVEQFDQCGAFVYIDETHWLKAGIEWADGAPRLSCVCCNVFSDWSVMPWEGTAAKIRLHKVNQGQALVMEANTLDGGDDDWQFVRICHLSPQVGDKSIGVNDEPSAAGSSTLNCGAWVPSVNILFVEPEFCSVCCV